MSSKKGEDEAMFETKAAKGLTANKLFSATILTGIVSIWIYRFTHLPRTEERGRYAWILISMAEFFLGLYWIITRSARLNVVHRYPFKDRLASRYGDRKLPLVDIFVCTADHLLEPPSLVINTVLSVISYNYPPEKLTVYLSDDGGSQLTFYALFEASKFSRHWIPFCKKYKVEPRSPQAYFSSGNKINGRGSIFDQEWTNMKKLYDDMKGRVDSAVAKNSIPEKVMDQHKGFSEWNAGATKKNHQSIVQILIDGWNPNSVDEVGERLPSLVYVSREKRPGLAHNYKAGSVNSLIRVSEEISNAPIILNLDCDMYANDPNSVRDALCFLLDENGRSISYVQHPQNYHNVTKDDVYANFNYVVNNIELAGLDAQGGTLYIGTGCFHRRESLSGKTYAGNNHKIEAHVVEDTVRGRSVEELEESSKVLATCDYEKNTLWGKGMGLVYGCPVEDIVTGLTIQCHGWKPVYYNPRKSAFLGVAPTSLDVSLVQFKRWSEGMFQIFCSKYCPLTYGRGKINLAARMGYCIYLLWASVSIPTIIYAVLPALSLLHDVPLFPKESSLWFAPFAYVFAAHNAYNLAEDVVSGDTVKGWWNLQRMVLIRRTTSFLFAFTDTVKRMLGLSETEFILTDKVSDEEKRKRYESGIIEFGKTPPLILIIIATIAILNLVSLGMGTIRALFFDSSNVFEMVFCGALVLLNLPVYEALLVRSDEGRIPTHVFVKSAVIASIASLVPIP